MKKANVVAEILFDMVLLHRDKRPLILIVGLETAFPLGNTISSPVIKNIG